MEAPGGGSGNGYPKGGIGLYNMPQGCSTSVALATGPNDEEEEGCHIDDCSVERHVQHVISSRYVDATSALCNRIAGDTVEDTVPQG